MKITTEELSTMQAVAAAATPGSWQYNPFDATIFSIGQPFATGVAPGEQPRPEDYDVSVLPVFNIHEEQEELENLENDAEFCCAARAFVPKAIEALRFTEASTEEALLILDNAMAESREGLLLHTELEELIDMAIQKLRPEPTPVHDEQALEQLAQQYPIDLPWMQPAGIVAMAQPSSPPCSPLSCDGCPACYKAGEPRPTTPTELPMPEGGEANG